MRLPGWGAAVGFLHLALDGAGTTGQRLPLVGNPLPVPTGTVGEDVVPVYVSEAMLDLYDARPGGWLPALGLAFPPVNAGTSEPRFFVAGVWRDYARQHGSVVMDRADFVRLSGDDRVNDLALHLDEGANETSVQEAIRALAREKEAEDLIEFASAGQIRATSLRIFDRSFAVTYWLQAVAIAIGLFGVAASFSAQVLARRREFGLLAHLGLTRRQILGLVALEGLAWTVLGAIAGLLLGLAVSLVLVHVVNPQSFHWTMDLALPWARLLALCFAVVLAGMAQQDQRTLLLEPGDSWLVPEGASHTYKILESFSAVEATHPPATQQPSREAGEIGNPDVEIAYRVADAAGQMLFRPPNVAGWDEERGRLRALGHEDPG